MSLPVPLDSTNSREHRGQLARAVNLLQRPRPAFNAYLAADTTNDKTGDSTAYPIICGTEVFDVGDNYNTSTGLFTAPTAGRYHFDGVSQVTNAGAAHTNASLRLVTSAGKTYLGSVGNMFGPVGAVTGLAVSATLQLAAGETVALVVIVAGGTKTVGIYSASPGANVVTYFSGARID